MDERTTIAAKWWAEQLTSASERANRERDLFAQPVSPEQIAAFEEALQGEVEALVKSGGNRATGATMLSVDYDPDEYLLRAVRTAGLNCAGMLYSARGLFWSKTRLWIYAHAIEVRCGYGGELVTVWTAPGAPTAARGA